jgi:hypothetical protein
MQKFEIPIFSLLPPPIPPLQRHVPNAAVLASRNRELATLKVKTVLP